MKILSVNAGSSTLKFSLYEMPEESIVMNGALERIGLDDGIFDIRFGNQKIKKTVKLKNHLDAVKILLKEITDLKIISSLDDIKAVGHRIVHGGDLYSSSVVIDDKIILSVDEFSSLAPLHNPANLTGIRAFKDAIPSVVQIGCFDTAFHQTIKRDRYLYPIPYEFYEKYKVRKYGFHGLSHKFITEKMIGILNNKKPNLIICHIGSGASVTAIENGESIDTSMGFTPNAGVMMGTRSGDVDYSIIPFIMKKEGLTLENLDTILNRKSGLEGITGMSDLRDLDISYLAGDEQTKLAFDIYTNKIVDYIAKYYVQLKGRVDAICFTAGAGENDSIIRALILEKLTAIGVVIDKELNDQTIFRKGVEGIITSSSSKIPAYVFGTDEELMIARDTFKLVE